MKCIFFVERKSYLNYVVEFLASPAFTILLISAGSFVIFVKSRTRWGDQNVVFDTHTANVPVLVQYVPVDELGLAGVVEDPSNKKGEVTPGSLVTTIFGSNFRLIRK